MASVEHHLDDILIQSFEEDERRDPDHKKQWIGLVDGDESQLDVLMLAAKEYKINLVITLDIIHFLEYLWKRTGAFITRRSNDVMCVISPKKRAEQER